MAIKASESPSSGTGSFESSKNKKIENFNVTLAKINGLAEDIRRELNSTAEDQKKYFEDKIQQERVRVVEILGIFIALFSFITVNFNIFSTVNDLYTAAIFSTFIFCVLSAMIVLMDILLFAYTDTNKSVRQERIFLLFIFIALIGGIMILLRSSEFSINNKEASVSSDSTLSVSCNPNAYSGSILE